MKGSESVKTWRELLSFPLAGRNCKPRSKGITMVIDKGLGISETRDLLNLAGKYIDFLKLGFGTSALYEQELLEEKINLVKNYRVDIYPGGTFLEIAILQNKLKEFLTMAKSLGFTAVEVSDGTVKIDPETRKRAINMAKDLEFKVLTEVGKKDPKRALSPDCLISQIKSDLENGSQWVIIEGRESGKEVGVYDKEGQFIKHALETILSHHEFSEHLVWEAPLKHQQQDLILRLGPNVNLGNVSPVEILSVEALRVGLRGDTLISLLK
ncbi:MAG TPA: phosphosulfolactate synthase [Clostridia bacterium]|nr:phosphosulfolactate synthase [Clostridia bacterium]